MNKNRKNKIDIVVKYFYPVAAGIETNIMETYSVLADKGWDVTVHASCDILTKKNCLPKEDTLRGIKIKRYPFRWYGYWPDIPWGETDLVCLHNFNIVPHGFIMLWSIILKIMHKKCFGLMLTPHGGFNPEWSIFPRVPGFLKRTYHYSLGALLINISVDGVRAVSEWECKEMIAHGLRPERVRVIDNGIEDEAYWDVDAKASENIKKQVKDFGRYIIQIGRIYGIKNYETTILALRDIPPDVKFIIAGPVGDGKYLRYLKELIRSLGFEDRVVFFGVIRGVDKYYLIKHAEMMVHMALWESFCNVVHEGLSQGLVCVVANNTALPYLIKDGVNGYCIETKNSSQVAEKVSFVLANKGSQSIRDMEKRNRVFGLENSWRDVASKMDEWYRQTVETIQYV
jgi:glycosyltransferase involved in cell wall biosynthesis